MGAGLWRASGHRAGGDAETCPRAADRWRRAADRTVGAANPDGSGWSGCGPTSARCRPRACSRRCANSARCASSSPRRHRRPWPISRSSPSSCCWSRRSRGRFVWAMVAGRHPDAAACLFHAKTHDRADAPDARRERQGRAAAARGGHRTGHPENPARRRADDAGLAGTERAVVATAPPNSAACRPC